MSQTRLRSPSFKLLFTIATAPRAFTASFFMSSPWLLPFQPPAGSMLPGTTAGGLKVRPASRDTASARPLGYARGSRNSSQST